MKRVITAVIFAVFAVAVCWLGRALTEKHVEEISDTMAQIDSLLEEGDTEQALELSRSFLNEWESIHGQLCLFLQHEHLDPLESVFAVLPYYIEQGEISLARSECRLVQTTTDHILKTERVTIENIL